MVLPALIPRRVLFGNPARVSPRLSPDGKQLAYLAPVDDVLNVWVRSPEGRVRPVTEDRERGVRAYDWAHDGRHLVYVQDSGGDEDWHLHVVDPETGEDRDVTPFDGVQARIIAADMRHPHDVLVGLNRDDPQLHDLYHLDLRTAELSLRSRNPGVVGWLVDGDLRARGGVRSRPDGGFEVLVGESDRPAEWEVVVTFDREDALSSSVVGLDRLGENLFLMSSKDAQTGRLVRLDLVRGETEILAVDPRHDVASVARHPDTWEVQMVTFLRDRMELQVLDDSIREDVQWIQAAGRGEVALIDRDQADVQWLVADTRDDGPISYHVWDRSRRRWEFLFEHRPELSRYELASMEPFSYAARDGLVIHGYLTFPPGIRRQQLPTVLNVHGGPWTRDVWGFDPEAQWLANRGYLCVQVNFRGSTGYGKSFVNAGDREWGGRMHDDLVDAVEWVVEQGYADLRRVAIYGGSYGGYAALVGATFTPELFACAVDLVGPSNLLTLIRSVPPYWRPMISQFHERVGNPDTDEAFLWSRSPLAKVDDIAIPVLVAQGANDPRVKQHESEQIVRAMRQKGIDHEYLLFPDEGHGFAKPENRMRFYAAVEEFLARHLGGRAEPS